MKDELKCVLIATLPILGIFTWGVGIVILPLILWLIFKKGSSSANVVGCNVLNTQITWLIILTLAWWIDFIGIIMGVLALTWFIITILQLIKVAQGDVVYASMSAYTFISPPNQFDDDDE